MTKVLEDLQDQDVDYGHVGENVYLVSVSIHQWRGQFKLRNAAIKLGKVELAKEIVTSPRWKLMPDGWHERFICVEGKIRGVVDRVAPKNTENCRMPIKGVDVVPRRKLKQLFDGVKEIETELFKPLVREFAGAWPTIVEELKTTIGPESWQFAAPYLPGSPSAVSRKFYVQKCVIPVVLSGSAELLSGDEAEEFADETAAYVRQFSQTVAQTIVSGLQEELNDAVDNLYNSIKNGKVVRGGTLEMVRRAFDKLEGFDMVMTPELKARVTAVKKDMANLEPRDVNLDIKDGAKGVAGTLAKALHELREQTADEARAFRRFGRQRSIDV